MTDMFDRRLFSSAPASSGGGARWLQRLGAVLAGGMLAAMGLVFMFSLLVWLLLMVAGSLLVSLVSGRPAGVALLWRRYRDLTRQRWPQARRPSATPRAAAATARHPAEPARIEDVAWRELPGQPDRSA